MSLSERLASPSSTRPQQCKIRNLYTTLPEEEIKALRNALRDPAYTTLGITRALLAEDVNISESSVRRHRTGMCHCGSV
jgi:FixJ family two-component response regulator